MNILKKISLFEYNNDAKIYLDMDGVIVDFEKGFKNLSNNLSSLEYVKQNDRSKFYDLISNNQSFWQKLDWMPDGKELYEYIKKYNPIILTCPTNDDECRKGKVNWIKRNIPGHTKIIFECDKYKYSEKDCILIDDTEDKIDDWNDKGSGIGILHKDSKTTIKKLKELGL